MISSEWIHVICGHLDLFRRVHLEFITSVGWVRFSSRIQNKTKKGSTSHLCESKAPHRMSSNRNLSGGCGKEQQITKASSGWRSKKNGGDLTELPKVMGRMAGPVVQQPRNSSYFHNGSEVFMSVWSEYWEMFNPACPLDLQPHHGFESLSLFSKQ